MSDKDYYDNSPDSNFSDNNADNRNVITSENKNNSASEISDTQSFNDDDWEDEIAQRIAKRVKKVKEKQLSNSSADDNLVSLLDSVRENNNTETSSDLNVTDHSATKASDLFINKNNQATKDNIMYKQANTENQSYTENYDGIQKTSPVSKYSSDSDNPAYEEKITSDTEKSKMKKHKKAKKSLKQKFVDLFPNRSDGFLEKIRKVVFLASITAICICSYIIIDYYVDNNHTQGVYENIMSDYSAVENSQPSSDADTDNQHWSLLSGAEKLLSINNDVVGVINIPGTDINYPVLQGKDNTEYLNKNINGEEARAGAIFLDYRNNFDRVVNGKLAAENSGNLIIYGHEMATGKMFGQLKNYKDYYSFYGEHPIIELNSNYHEYKYKIFAFFIVDCDDKTDTYFDYWNRLNFSDEKSFYDFVNEAKRRTLRLNDVDVKYGDPLITLSTCNGIFGQDSGGRFVVLARRVRDGEDPYAGTQNSSENPNPKWPSAYYKYNDGEYDSDAEFVPYG